MHKTVDPIARNMTGDSAIIGSKLTVIDGIRSWTTCFCDYGNNMDRIVKEVYTGIGVRANVCSTINELGAGKRSAGELYDFDKDIGEQKLEAALSLIDKWHDTEDGRITCVLGPQAADMMSEGLLYTVMEHAKTKGMKIHMHVSQGGRKSHR